MRFLVPICFLISSLSWGQSFQSFHDFKEVTITGDTLDLSAYAGKKVLVVNTASFCGFTPQFGDLQKLDSLYESYGFEVIGFPCNDFGNQDPHNDSAINQFCQNNYGVQFQMMHKIDVVSGDTAELYKWLQNQNRNGVATAHVTWNFNKFLIDRQGKWVRHYTQTKSPLDTAITNWITADAATSVRQPAGGLPQLCLANPSKGDLQFVNLTSKHLPLSIQVFTVHGGQVASFNFKEINQAPALKEIRNGLYLVRVFGQGQTQSFRWLVQRH